MVSSVGPLGYCRLAGVRQVTVPGEERRPGYVEYPAGSLLTTPATMWTSAHPSSTGSSGHPLDTKKEGVSSTQPPTEDTQPATVSPRIVEGPATSPDTDEGKTSKSDEGSTLQPTDEITTINTTIYTPTNTYTTTTSTSPSSTSSFGTRYKGKPTSSPRHPITSTTITSTSTSTSTTDSSVTTAEANRPEELLTTTQSLSLDDPTEAGAEGANFMSQEPQTTTTGIPGTPRGQNKSSGVDEAVTPRVEMGVGGGDDGGEVGGDVGVRKNRKNKNKKMTQGHTTVKENVSAAPRRNTTTPAATKGRRKKKGKYRRRKKKNRRKRPRERDGGKVIGRSHGRGAPRPEPPLHHLLRSHLAGREEPLASPLLQRPPQQEKLVSTGEVVITGTNEQKIRVTWLE